MKIPIKYRKGYRNQLAETVSLQLPIQLFPDEYIDTEYYSIDAGGRMTVKIGYAWDGASGPTWDYPAKHIVVPSLVHDVLCQAIRAGHMRSVTNARKHADKLFYFLLRERGMNVIRAKIWYRGVRLGSRMDGQNKPILEAS